MALGKELVRTLELDDTGTTLERWMAHHLAEVMDQVDTTTGVEKVEAQHRAVELIQRLWAKRRTLPASADPLGGCREAIESLSHMMPDQNLWTNYRGRHDPEGMLHNLFDTMARIVVGGILLTIHSTPGQAGKPQLDALEQEERFLLEQLAWWQRALQPSLPKICVTLVPPVESGSAMREQEEAVDEQPSSANDAHQFSLEQADSQIQSVTLEYLQLLRIDLDALIEKWKRRASGKSG